MQPGDCFVVAGTNTVLCFDGRYRPDYDKVAEDVFIVAYGDWQGRQRHRVYQEEVDYSKLVPISNEQAKILYGHGI